MEYNIQALSQLAGISTRTLRYYDQIGLLKPSRVTEAGYRYYGETEVSFLQQILFYRERGFDLKTIRKILHDQNFDMLKAMKDHLRTLENQKAETEALIQTVKKTIAHMKGERDMSHKEKFQALKEKYDREARQKYGDQQVEASNRKMMNLSHDQFARWQELDDQILSSLEAAVAAGVGTDSQEAKDIAQLHKEWLTLSTPTYSTQMHKGIAMMYICDERFTQYYDRNTAGCAQFLCDAIQHWI